jgi:hypothetical protein
MNPYLKNLIQIYARAENDIIEQIMYKRSKNYVDYAEQAALKRVRKILQDMANESWIYVPKMIRLDYYGTRKDITGYANAEAVTAADRSVVNRLVTNLMGEVTEAASTTGIRLSKLWADSYLIGRRKNDIFRTSLLEGLTLGKAEGLGITKAVANFLSEVKKSGITAFVDKSGKKWGLRAYCTMAARSSSRQATNLAVLNKDEEQDLFQMSSHAGSCPICIPFQGRVFSKSGTHPYYPPLADAFGLVDKGEGQGLKNTYLTIHPNCMHSLIPFTEDYKSAKEIEAIRNRSNPETNPYEVPADAKKSLDQYNAKVSARTKLMQDHKQWQKYRLALGKEVPGFQTFHKHKAGGSDRYAEFQELYRIRNKELKG